MCTALPLRTVEAAPRPVSGLLLSKETRVDETGEASVRWESRAITASARVSRPPLSGISHVDSMYPRRDRVTMSLYICGLPLKKL